MAKKKPQLIIFKCRNCREYIAPKGSLICNGTYGTCKLTKRAVHRDLAFCEADGLVDPDLWYMQEPDFSMYLRLENLHGINILPGFIDRKKYKEINDAKKRH